jgi:hypothetical protein
LGYRILITTRSYGVHCPDQLERLEKLGEVTRAKNPPLKADTLAQIIHEYDAIVAGLDEYTAYPCAVLPRNSPHDRRERTEYDEKRRLHY